MHSIPLKSFWNCPPGSIVLLPYSGELECCMPAALQNASWIELLKVEKESDRACALFKALLEEAYPSQCERLPLQFPKDWKSEIKFQIGNRFVFTHQNIYEIAANADFEFFLVPPEEPPTQVLTHPAPDYPPKVVQQGAVVLWQGVDMKKVLLEKRKQIPDVEWNHIKRELHERKPKDLKGLTTRETFEVMATTLCYEQGWWPPSLPYSKLDEIEQRTGIAVSSLFKALAENDNWFLKVMDNAVQVNRYPGDYVRTVADCFFKQDKRYDYSKLCTVIKQKFHTTWFEFCNRRKIMNPEEWRYIEHFIPLFESKLTGAKLNGESAKILFELMYTFWIQNGQQNALNAEYKLLPPSQQGKLREDMRLMCDALADKNKEGASILNNIFNDLLARKIYPGEYFIRLAKRLAETKDGPSACANIFNELEKLRRNVQGGGLQNSSDTIRRSQ